MKIYAGLIGALALSSIASFNASAQSCELTVPISSDQARELKATMQSEKADELDKIDAYETLRCADRPILQNLAATTALKTDSKALKTEVVRDLLFAKDTIVVELTADEQTAPLAIKSISEKPTHTLQVNRVLPEQDKMALNGPCTNVISYGSLAVDLEMGCSNYSLSGRLTFDGKALSGKLSMTIDKPLGSVNAKIGLVE